MSEEKNISQLFLEYYKKHIAVAYPDYISQWPLLSGFGHTVHIGHIGRTHVVVFTDDKNVFQQVNGVGDISLRVGFDKITEENIESIRSKIGSLYSISDRGAVILLEKDEDLIRELKKAALRHAKSMGLINMKVFLSHKGSNKAKVRDFNQSLRLIGYDTWLDEDDMVAGVNIHRGMADGLDKSCAAVFFLTTEFKDESYLQNEIDLAIQRHNDTGGDFKIISLVLDDDVEVPRLLKRFLWKSPSTDLEAIRDIIKALPLSLGEVQPT